MEENLEIYFCEICNESVPANDLTSKAAMEVKGKVIGPCCVPDVQQRPQGRAGVSSTTLTAIAAVVLAAIAGATIHLEWRLSTEVQTLATKMDAVEGNVASSGAESVTDLQKSLEGTLREGALAPIEQQIQDLEGKLKSDQSQILAKLDTTHVRLTVLGENQSKLTAGQRSLSQEIQGVENEVLRLERDVAAVAAAPRGPALGGPGDATARPGADAEVEPALPTELMQQVARLKDGDAGNRFEAVDQLIQSKHPDVLEHLLPMLKDSDAFVRRLTAEGLSSFRDKSSVDALLVALADPEGIVRHTAHDSLQKLTGQKLAFDPDGTNSARTQSQRRWKDWWAKSRDKF